MDMTYTKLTNNQLLKHGKAIISFNKEERLIISKLCNELGLPSGQVLGVLIKKLLGFQVNKVLYKAIKEKVGSCL